MANNRPNRRNSKKTSPFKAGYNPGQGYAPTFSGGGGWAAWQSSIVDGKPLFTCWDVPRMLRDPRVVFGLSMRVAPCARGKWNVKCDRPEVKEYIDKMFQVFWRTTMPEVVSNYLCWGAGAAVFEYDMEGDKAHLVNGKGVVTNDCTVRVWKEGEEKGKFAGFDLETGNSLAAHSERFVPLPYSFWFSGQSRRDRFYDTSALAGGFQPWLMKNTRGGALDMLSQYFRKHAIGNMIVRHPVGKTDPNNPDSIDNQDMARLLAERRESGSTLIVPQFFLPTGDAGKSEPAWAFEQSKESGTAAPILEWVEWIDKELLVGLGIPPEVVEAQQSGLGQGGRAIPQEAFYQITDMIVGQLIHNFNEQAVKPAVLHSFGEVKYSIEAIPLAEVDKQESQEGQSAAGGMAPPGGMPPGLAPEAAPEQSPPQPGAGDGFELAVNGAKKSEPEAKGDPTAGGLVPYLGKYGGKGKKNPRTGKVTYLSNVGERPVGIVLAPIGGALRNSAYDFQSGIDPKDLTADGLERDSHVTICHGLQGHSHKPVWSALESLGSLTFVPAETRCFQTADADVLYVSCQNSYDWELWHEALKDQPCCTSDHKGYVPHMTLAYLKRGTGQKYVGEFLTSRESVSIPEVVYHTPDGREECMTVWPTADEMEEAFSGGYNRVSLGWIASKHKKNSRYWVPNGMVDLPENRSYGKDADFLAAAFGRVGGEPNPGNSMEEHEDLDHPSHPSQSKPPVPATPKAPASDTDDELRPFTDADLRRLMPGKYATASTPVPAKAPAPAPAPAKAPTTTAPSKLMTFAEYAADMAGPVAPAESKAATASTPAPAKAPAQPQKDLVEWTGSQGKQQPAKPTAPTVAEQSKKLKDDHAAQARKDIEHVLSMTPEQLDQKGFKFFRTSQGSVYVLNPKGGQTIRVKSLHAGHDQKDTGLKGSSEKTVYVNTDAASKIGMAGTTSASQKRVLLGKDGKLHFVSWNEKEKKMGRDLGDVEYSHEPQAGMSPVELGSQSGDLKEHGEAFKWWHPGNAISEFIPAADGHKFFSDALKGAIPTKQPAPAPSPTAKAPPTATKPPLPVAKPAPAKAPPTTLKPSLPVAKPTAPPVAQPVPGQAKPQLAKPPVASPKPAYQHTTEHVAHAKQWSAAAAQSPKVVEPLKKLGLDKPEHGPAIQQASEKAMLRLRQEMSNNPKITTLKYWATIGGKKVLFTIRKKPNAAKVNLSHGIPSFADDEWDVSLSA